MDDFKRIYLEKARAVIPNLPHPVPKRTADESHAYVSLLDLLANELAKATEFDKFYFETGCLFSAEADPTISTTPWAYDLFILMKEEVGEFVLYLWFTGWRDDFDPNGIKKSRNQVWTNTFTCCPPPS